MSEPIGYNRMRYALRELQSQLKHHKKYSSLLLLLYLD